MKKKRNSTGNQPATQADLAMLGGELTRRIDGLDTRITGLDGRMDGLDGRMDGLDGRMDRLEKTMQVVKDISQRTLDIVQTIDANRREERALNLPTRVAQLEKDSAYLHKEVTKLRHR